MTVAFAVSLAVTLLLAGVVCLGGELMRLDRERQEEQARGGPDEPAAGRDVVIRSLPIGEPGVPVETRWTGLDDLQWERYLGRRSG